MRFFVLLSFAAVIIACKQQKSPTPEQVAADRARGIELPKTIGVYQWTKDYVEDVPDDDYIHASVAAHEAFRDIKYSVRIHWGVYSKWGIEASWPFINRFGPLAMDAAKKQEYMDLYKTFNPTQFNADEWIDWFKSCGMQAFAFTTKHHDGFSMYHTATRVHQRLNYLQGDSAGLEPVIEDCDVAYSIAETPFKRDIVGELCDAAHRKNFKIDLYYSHPDWYDADFRPYISHPAGYIPRTPEATDRFVKRHREQLTELLTKYGKIDMVCLDMSLGADVWPEIKKTVKIMRSLQPDVMIRVRGIGNYGDYFQPEQEIPADALKTNMPWMSICLLGKIFAFDPVAENYKGAKWVIHSLIECVAKGGSFMVCIGPDEFGKFHPEAVRQLNEVGEWLKINGKGIYETRGRDVWHSGDFYFTRSKNSKRVYAFTENAETLRATSVVERETSLHIPAITPRKGGKVYMFGNKKPLKWQQAGDGVDVEIPANVTENLPCKYAWGFEIEV
ncbi:MAG: alpha-L-fucosidase [Tannerella sp.]|jgi:alpha-L-fucosidase|nr:alpha-L-fucosidase [Tannerella sp.]